VPAIAAVTGASGFVGRALVRALLERGDAVRVLTRDPARAAGLPRAVEIHVGDLASDAGAPIDFVDGADALYHLAGEIARPSAMRRLHVDGTRALAAAAARRVGRWVQLSSAGVYGPVREGVVDETRALDPRGEYELTKAASERIAREAADAGAFDCAVLRPTIIFGPGMPNRSLDGLFSVVARGLFFHPGPPGASANYVYVDNVADALVACATAPAARRGVYNLSDFLTMEAFVEAIAAALGAPAPRRRLPETPVRWLARAAGRLPGFPLTESRVDALTSRARYSTARIERELGYAHRVSLREGVGRAVAAWQARR
jgi:nucleoside-diphosphate-sugar epimerase